MLRGALPDYRSEILSLLCERWGGRFRVYAGAQGFDPTARTCVDIGSALVHLENRFMLGRRLLWQRRAVRHLIGPDVAILEYNPRILSVWVILLIRRSPRRRTILWGHAWARKGPKARSEGVRKVMRLLADVVLVYTESQRRELATVMKADRVVAAPNALYRRRTMRPEVSKDISSVLYVGRLIEAKKPRLLLDAFLIGITQGLPTDCRLVFLGAGPESERLRARVADVSEEVATRIEFVGHVPPSRVSKYYGAAMMSVSPGYVGLSITQSLSFGVPMVIARDEPHSPEIEAAREGFNAVFVPSDDPLQLATTLVRMALDRARWIERREEISRDCADRYSVEAMAAGIERAVDA